MLTSHIDANFMYGSNFRVADSLRTLQGGLLKVTSSFSNVGLKPLLPPKTNQPEDGCIPSTTTNAHCFLAGDNRVNEQLALGVLHTLTVREHNRIASELGKINPYWDDETLYQEARHIMAALIQHITYNEFLPLLLGEKLMEKYSLKVKNKGFANNYDPLLDSTVPASFGTAAFRFGHSLLPDAMEMRSVSHKLIGERKLSEMLQQPYDLYKPGYIDAYILGMVNQPSQAMDSSITNQVTNHLFQDPAKSFGRDLASINIARAREHGVPGYMAYRKLCGLDDMRTWDDMWIHLPNDTVRHYLNLYSHPDDIDLWSAGVSEYAAHGSMLGPVFSCIIAMTFKNLKIGDRFWYENQGFRSSFTLGQLTQIRKYSLARMLCNTADNVQTIQVNALLLPDYDRNPRVNCKSQQIPDIDLRYWSDANYNEDKEPGIKADETSPNTYQNTLYTHSPGIEAIPHFYLEKHPELTTLPSSKEKLGIHENLSPVNVYETPAHEIGTIYGEHTYPPMSNNQMSKPPGFDQVIYNLFTEQKNKSQFVVHLTDTLGISQNNIDNHHYTDKAVKLE